MTRRYLRDLDGGFTARELVGALIGGVLGLAVGYGMLWLTFVTLAALGVEV